jgi:hypothetical protein
LSAGSYPSRNEEIGSSASLVAAELVQLIRYAENEANYCVQCQSGGKLLADRVLSRLLKDDWPKTLGELEKRKRGS